MNICIYYAHLFHIFKYMYNAEQDNINIIQLKLEARNFRSDRAISGKVVCLVCFEAISRELLFLVHAIASSVSSLRQLNKQ